MEQYPLKYLILFIELTFLGAAGYLGFLLFPRWDLLQVDGIALLVLAVGAGISAFFSPCSFPALILQWVSPDEIETNTIPRRIWWKIRNLLGFVVGLGFFFYLMGVLFSWVGGIVFQGLIPVSVTGRVLHLGVGGLLILFGLIQTNAIILDFRILPRITRGFLHAQAALRWEHPALGGLLLGFWYIFAGFG